MSHGFARTGLASIRVPVSSGAWIRPTEWLALPTVSPGDQKIAMLVAVFNTTNYLAFSVSGNYTVDWGDGTAPTNYTAGTTAQKALAWSDYSPSTLTSTGYRQAVVTITPQSGQNLTSVNLNVRHTTPTVAHTTGVLDMVVGGPYISTLSPNTSNVTYRMLRQFEWVGTCPITDFTNMFAYCSALSSVSLDTSAGTNFYSMFSGCSALSSVTLDTSAGTNFTQMFYGCSSVASVTLTGCKYSVSIAGCVLSSTALDALYTSLGTAAGSQTITVSGNYGTTGDSPSIATSKGWTVSG